MIRELSYLSVALTTATAYLIVRRRWSKSEHRAAHCLHAALRRDGYAVMRGFLSADDVAETRAQLARFITTIPKRVGAGTLPAAHVMYDDVATPGTLKQIQQLLEHDRYFGGLMDRLRTVASEALGEAALPQNMQYFNKPPTDAYATSTVLRCSRPTPAHQDGYYWCLEPSGAGGLGGLTMWLALDRADEDNGCLRYVVGSTADGLRPHDFSGVLGFSQTITDYGEADAAREVPIVAQPGDLIMHTALLTHRAGANLTKDRPRRAIGAIFYGASARVDRARHEARAREIALRNARLAGQERPA